MSGEVAYWTVTGYSPEALAHMVREPVPPGPSMGPCSNRGYPKVFDHKRPGRDPSAIVAAPNFSSARRLDFIFFLRTFETRILTFNPAHAGC
jgi:hypothetical protein